MKYYRRLVLLTGSAGGFGVFAGIKYQESKQENSFLNWKRELLPERRPGLPLFGSVSAATPIPESRLAPITAEPEVPVPQKEVPGLPAEPPRGTNRIAEIMRFGFPGLDNIRSHR